MTQTTTCCRFRARNRSIPTASSSWSRLSRGSGGRRGATSLDASRTGGSGSCSRWRWRAKVRWVASRPFSRTISRSVPAGSPSTTSTWKSRRASGSTARGSPGRPGKRLRRVETRLERWAFSARPDGEASPEDAVRPPEARCELCSGSGRDSHWIEVIPEGGDLRLCPDHRDPEVVTDALDRLAGRLDSRLDEPVSAAVRRSLRRSVVRSPAARHVRLGAPCLRWRMIDCKSVTRLFYRAMTPNADGLPTVGRTARSLGVRSSDVTVGRGGWVEPGTGGMSVAPGSPWNLPHHRRPRSLGRGSTGHDEDRVFEISEGRVVAESLVVRPDGRRPELHAFVEPATRMQLGEYETALAATRPAWKVVWPR